MAKFLHQLFTRNNAVWLVGLVGSCAAYTAAHLTGLSPAHADLLQHLALICATICGTLGNSPLPKGN